MKAKKIRNDDAITAAFIHLESIFQAEECTPEADEIRVLIALIAAYEIGMIQ